MSPDRIFVTLIFGTGRASPFFSELARQFHRTMKHFQILVPWNFDCTELSEMERDSLRVKDQFAISGDRAETREADRKLRTLKSLPAETLSWYYGFCRVWFVIR
jgi:hypothetical protein